MDIGSINAAMHAVTLTKQLVKTLYDGKVDADAKEKINAALDKLGDVQDGMFQMREALHKLQSERQELARKLEEAESWTARSNYYAVVETEGGAVVYKYSGHNGPAHYACPSCFNKKELHFLQDNRTLTGKFRCTGCKAEYPVKPRANLEGDYRA